MITAAAREPPRAMERARVVLLVGRTPRRRRSRADMHQRSHAQDEQSVLDSCVELQDALRGICQAWHSNHMLDGMIIGMGLAVPGQCWNSHLTSCGSQERLGWQLLGWGNDVYTCQLVGAVMLRSPVQPTYPVDSDAPLLVTRGLSPVSRPCSQLSGLNCAIHCIMRSCFESLRVRCVRFTFRTHHHVDCVSHCDSGLRFGGCLILCACDSDVRFDTLRSAFRDSRPLRFAAGLGQHVCSTGERHHRP